MYLQPSASQIKRNMAKTESESTDIIKLLIILFWYNNELKTVHC